MSRLFLTNINLAQNQLLNAVVQNLATAPSSPLPGQVYYDTVLLAQYTWNGSAWVAADASKLSNIPTTAIANFATTVQGYHLNQFAVPTANLPMAGFKLTGLNAAPSSAGDSAEYSWVVGRSLNTIAAAAANTANLPMAGFKLTGLATPSSAGDSAEYSWVLGRSLSAFALPTASIPMGGFTLTGLPTPTAAGQAAEYNWVISQVQSAASGISSKDPVNAVSTANVATMSGTATIDGVALVAGNRVLLIGQTTLNQNGPWVVQTGAWTRPATEGSGTAELDLGAMWLSLAGTVNAGTQWRLSSPSSGVITPNTSNIAIVQFGAGNSYTAGNGIGLAGNAFSATASTGILVSSAGIAIDTTGTSGAIVARKFAATIGDGSTTAIVVTHNLGTQDVLLQVRQASTPFGEVECDMAATSAATATFTFTSAPTSGQYRVMVVG